MHLAGTTSNSDININVTMYTRTGTAFDIDDYNMASQTSLGTAVLAAVGISAGVFLLLILTVSIIVVVYCCCVKRKMSAGAELSDVLARRRISGFQSSLGKSCTVLYVPQISGL